VTEVALPDWVPITGLVAAVATAVVSAVRIRPESRKMRQDGTAALMTSTGAMVVNFQGEMDDLRAEVKELRQWRNRKETWDRIHSRWDIQVVKLLSTAGIDVPDPPPLFDDGGTAA
jgi:hypothetical protein